MPNGIFIIDAQGQITWSNWSSKSESHGGLKIARGRIATVTPNDQKTLNGALEKALKVEAGRAPEPLTVVIQAADGSTRQVIHVVPMRRRIELATPHSGEPRSQDEPASDGAMVFVVDAKTATNVSPELLQKHLGLSPSESRIAALIAAGERPRDIAVKLGLTENSARVILKRIFAKTGVSRQSELAALVSNLTSISLS